MEGQDIPCRSFCQESHHRKMGHTYHASSRAAYMRARRTTLGYREDCQLKGAVVDREGTRALVSFDSHEWPRMQQEKTREQELASGKALACSQHESKGQK
jgi:hypothetical protein